MNENTDFIKKGEKIFAIVAAAGQGSRMKSDRNKQFLELDGVLVLARTLTKFENSNLIDGIIIISNNMETDAVMDICKKYSISKLIGIALGGDTRQESVRNSLNYLSDYLTDSKNSFPNLTDTHDYRKSEIEQTDIYVLIHDGARPFVKENVIKRCVEGAREHLACGAGVPLKDTIKKVDLDGRIIETPNRETLWAIQTPQAFLFSLIKDCHNKAFEEGLMFTDDTGIVEHYGKSVYMVMGDYSNIKITTPEDMKFGEAILKDEKIQ